MEGHQLLLEIVEGMKIQREFIEKELKINDYIREMCDLFLGRIVFQKQQESKQKTQNKLLTESSRTFTKKGDDDLKHIRHRSDGRWEFRIRRKYETVFITKQTKEKLLKAIKEYRDKKSQNYSNSKKKQKFEDFAMYWFTTFKKPNISESSAKFYSNIIKNHLNVLDDLNVGDINLEIAQNVINKEKGRMKEIVYLTIKQILKQAYCEDYIKKDIAQFLKKGKIQRNERHHLLFDEQKLLWNSLKDDHFSMLIRFYLLTGCRRAESNITKSDLFEEERGCFVYINGTKTEKSKRYVKISKRLYDTLMNYKDDKLFYSDYKSIEKRFRNYVQNLGLNITIHQLRHTFSTNLYILGVPDKKRQSYLGHASIVMTNDVYTHEDPTLTSEKITELYGDWLPKF